MIRTYIVNIRQFEEERDFQTALSAVSPYRQQKIALLKNEKEKRRSLGAAFALNAALSHHGLCERNMEYILGDQGKPVLRDYPGLHFSLSHSGDYAICSLGELEVGCDIERIRPDKMRVADRFYTEEEKRWLYQAKGMEEQESRLFQLWTMKESFLKVTGRGMSLPLRDFTVWTGENGTGRIGHSLNDNSYIIKEYDLPEVFRETEGYRISVCCEIPGYRASVDTGMSGSRTFVDTGMPGSRTLVDTGMPGRRTSVDNGTSGDKASACYEIPDFAPGLEAVL